jgi:DNA repair protein RecN (Recombination protein N)
MLRELLVRRLAVIEDIQVRFGAGLNILTGETGAGKSILVTAIGLALGWRAAGDLIRTGCDDAEIEARFDNPGGEVKSILQELGVESAPAIHVRRQIQTAGRNRVEINGQGVALAGLRRLCEALLNLYGQHEAQGLMRPESHLLYLDEYADLRPARERVGELVAALKSLDARLADLHRREAERESRLGYLRYVMDEITAANVAPGEDEELAARVKVLANAEALLRIAHEVGDVLYDRETGAVNEQVGMLCRDVEAKRDVDERLAPIADGLREIVTMVEDVATRARDYADGLEFDPRRLAEAEERLQVLRDLKKKYGGTLEAVLAARESAVQESAALEKLTTDLVHLANERRAAAAKLVRAAKELSAARQAASDKMAREVERELKDLDMAGTRFQAPVEPLASGGIELDGLRLDDTGADQVEFLISPNVGELPRPLARIASGGELSRLMLAIKRVLARHFPVPTLIFDEIDAGVGGAQAERLGRKLREVAGEHQVLCITHLPQIAAMADAHYLVVKSVQKGRTKTAVELLDETGRVEEMARMLGGETITPAARDAARELMAGVNRGRRQARQKA